MLLGKMIKILSAGVLVIIAVAVWTAMRRMKRKTATSR